MKNFLLGSIFSFLGIYSIGSTYLLYKGVNKRVRSR